MTVLLVIGVGVVALGAFVLLLFPDRPGGKIAWQGAEVSSIGAGLPLIVVGIAAIAISGSGAIGDDGGGLFGGSDGGGGDSRDQTTAALECPDDLSASVPPERVASVELGANAQIVAGLTASKTEPFGLRLTDGGETVGAITARFFPASGVFRIQSFVDADCDAMEVVSLVPGEGRLDAVPEHSDVRIDLMDRAYVLNFGGGKDIRVNFNSFTP